MMEEPSLEQVEAVLERHSDAWMELPEVVGTGIGRCGERLCIRVLVTRRSENLEERIPERVDGIEVDLEETGRIEPRDPPGESVPP